MRTPDPPRRPAPMYLTDDDREILRMVTVLDAGAATIPYLNQQTGRTLSVHDMRPFIRAGLMREVERKTPPVIGFTLLPDGYRALNMDVPGWVDAWATMNRSAAEPLPRLTMEERHLRRCQLYRRFDAGDGDGKRGLVRLATEFGMSWQGVQYLRRRWMQLKGERPAYRGEPRRNESNGDRHSGQGAGGDS